MRSGCAFAEDSAPSGTRTHTVTILSRLPLPLGYRGNEKGPAVLGPI